MKKNRGNEGRLKMKTHATSSAIASLVVALALAGGGASAWELAPLEITAVALTEGEYEQLGEDSIKAYGNPLTITAAAFRSDGVNPGELRRWMPDDAIRGNDSANAYAVAPVYLPHGATIASVGVAVYDGFGGTTGACGDVTQRDVSVILLRVDNYTGDLHQMSFFTTSGMSGDRQYFLDSDVELGSIQYPTYSYYAVAKLCHSSQGLYAMQIFFSLP